MSINVYPTGYLLSALENEYRGMDCTKSKCDSCENDTSGMYCTLCVLSELERRAGKWLAMDLDRKLSHINELKRQVTNLKQQILEFAK